MVKKYVDALENREIYAKTGSTWRLQDVPKTWRAAAEKQVLADGYIFLEDGTAAIPETEEE